MITFKASSNNHVTCLYYDIFMKEQKELLLDREFRNNYFQHTFLNQDILHKNTPRHLKLGMLLEKVHIKKIRIFYRCFSLVRKNSFFVYFLF